jgi:predicted alpha/beta-fold hydrolase
MPSDTGLCYKPRVTYLPARWLPGRDLMTIFGAVARTPRQLPVKRERWELADGDFLDVDRMDAADPEAPLVLLLHGLEGSSRAGYIRGALATARSLGLSACALNFRGCSGELNRLPRFYHSGETGDLAASVERLAGERPGRPLGLLGYSLGGNVVAKYLAERGDAVPTVVRAAAVISVPFDLAACARTLDADRAGARFYRAIFLRSLRRKALSKAARFPEAIDAAAARHARTFAEFDGRITAPLNGFGSAEEYWSRSSSGPLIGAVRRPLFVLAARDDPFIPEPLPKEAKDNPRVVAEVTEIGGHLGFIEGAPWSFRRYAEWAPLEWLAARLGLGQNDEQRAAAPE